uniref:Uncharacterized protein n=1 Tax=Panagrolaimus superbus TaxID=310955 RepID=A0A914Y8G5_9BILA
MRVPKPLSESQFESTIAEGRKIEESLATRATTEEETGNGYFVDKKVDNDQTTEGISKEVLNESTKAQMKAAGDEKKQIDTSFMSSEEQEKTQGIMKSASQAEIAAKLKESQETMRNLIEQHEIIDSDLSAVQKVRESPRSSQERSMKASSDEQKQIDTSLEAKSQDHETYAIRKSPSQTDIAAKVKAAGNEIRKIDTTLMQ